METLLEEIALIAGSSTPSGPITPAVIDLAVANCADLWGLLQPYSHLNAGRVASGIFLAIFCFYSFFPFLYDIMYYISTLILCIQYVCY